MINKFNQLLCERELSENRSGINKLKDEFSKSNYAIETLEKTELHGHNECVNSINFNDDGSLIVSGGDDETVRIWDVGKRKCLTTLYGHSTNVFATNFLNNDNRKVISGGNDADIRYYDIENQKCTVYKHHSKKVLKLSVCPTQPQVFLSSSSDGSVRLFDVRQKYKDTEIQPIQTAPSNNDGYRAILPQVIGGGRGRTMALPLQQLQQQQSTSTTDSPSSSTTTTTTTTTTATTTATTNKTILNENPIKYGNSLLINFDPLPLRRSFRYSITIPKTTIFSVEYHPFDGYSFITASSDGTVRLFDQRMIPNHSSESFVNIYRNIEAPFPSEDEATGCAFSKNGNEIVVTYLNDNIYLYDLKKNYSKEYSLDYFKDYSNQNKNKNKKKKRSNHSRGRSRNINSSNGSGSGGRSSHRSGSISGSGGVSSSINDSGSRRDSSSSIASRTSNNSSSSGGGGINDSGSNESNKTDTDSNKNENPIKSTKIGKLNKKKRRNKKKAKTDSDISLSSCSNSSIGSSNSNSSSSSSSSSSNSNNNNSTPPNITTPPISSLNDETDNSDSNFKKKNEKEEQEDDKEEKEIEKDYKSTKDDNGINNDSENEKIEKEEEEEEQKEQEEQEEQEEEQEELENDNNSENDNVANYEDELDSDEQDLSLIFDYYHQLLVEARLIEQRDDDDDDDDDDNSDDNDNDQENLTEDDSNNGEEEEEDDDDESDDSYYGNESDDDDGDDNEDKDEEDQQDSEKNNSKPFLPKTFKQVYSGHVSEQTIKSVNFYGPNSEYIVSGSDDSKLFIWDKESAKIVRILEGHDSHVNSVACHPNEPCIATSGIDPYICLWEPTKEYPDETEMQRRKKTINHYSTLDRYPKRDDTSSFPVPSGCSNQ
ncbi:hypothetical protein ACTFIR_004548 [Dictyostelium discoideum]